MQCVSLWGSSLSSPPSHNSSRWIPFGRPIHTCATSEPDVSSPTPSFVSLLRTVLDQHNVQRRTRMLRKRSQNHAVSPFAENGPSGFLIAALKESGYAFAVPPTFKNKVDLSRVPPLSLKPKTSTTKNLCRRPIIPSISSTETFTAAKKSNPRLQLILANYIRRVDPLLNANQSQFAKTCDQTALDHALIRVFNNVDVTYLHSRGYEASDVVVWVWILTARASEQAALRLLAISDAYSKGRTSVIPRVPEFVFLFLLRRREVTARALRYLIIHAWSRLRNQHDPPMSLDSQTKETSNDISSKDLQRTSGRPTYHKMSESTIIIMVVRLLRHARFVWPAAINSIAMIVTKYVDGISPDVDRLNLGKMSRDVSIRLTKIYNRVLSLLAVPSSEHPLRSVPYHQQAQLSILRRMNEFEPALIINREGYRAAIQVQLAHRKTLQEKEWAELQAKSWPPWKEAKLGIDVDKGIEMGISRARESMARLKEAGYGGQAFEDAANIFSGWDTDQSPTIQTRISFQSYRPYTLQQGKGRNNPWTAGRSGEGGVWAARILSTRTVNEAWACFLAHKEDALPPPRVVYYAMIEKLIFDRKRLESEQGSEKKRQKQLWGLTENQRSISYRVAAGDGKEVLPTPSPREAIYVRTPAPSLTFLFRQMLKDGIKPSGRFLAFLLVHAESFDEGIDYLRSSSLPPDVVRIMVDEKESDFMNIHQSLELLPDYLLAAHIRFLVSSRAWKLGLKFTSSQVLEKFGEASVITGPHRQLASSCHTFLQTPVRQAFRLMSIMRPFYRPPWNSLFAALARRPRMNTRSDDVNANDILSWKLTLELIRQMEEIRLGPDFQQFQHMCTCLEKAIWASHHVLARKTEVPVFDQDEYTFVPRKHDDPSKYLQLEAQLVFDSGLAPIKALFIQKSSRGLKSDSQEFNSTLTTEYNAVSELLLPRLLDIPSPAQLHAFIRVLGLLKDYEGIHDLVKWMVDFAPELKSITNELQGGSTSMRRSIVAIRVFLEQSWMYYGSAEDAEDQDQEQEQHTEEDGTQAKTFAGASEVILQKVYEAIESVENWGGWPYDEEVEAYCRKGKFL